MKEELLKVLNVKLESVNNNINALNNINDMLDLEDNNLEYVDKILGIFEKEGEDQYEINNFVGLDKENFDKVMKLMPDTTSEKFDTNSCNYDGLVYLINGINNGISLTLTNEQEEAIKLMINGLNDMKIEYLAKIEGINLAKGDLEEQDLNTLNEKKNVYNNILDEFENDNYVSEIDEVMESINYSKVEEQDQVDMLSYLLKYNAEVYDDLAANGGFRENIPFHSPEVTNIEVEEEVPEEVEPEVELPVEEETTPELPIEEPEIETPVEETSEPTFDLPIDETADLSSLIATDVEVPVEEPVPVEENKEEVEPEVEFPVEEESSNIDIPETMLSNLINETETNEAVNTVDEEELKKTLEDYHIKYDDLENKEELLTGDIENYKDILNAFKDNDLLSDVTKNEIFLKDILLNSNKDIVNEVLDIVRRDFSIDEEDFFETARITIDSMPSIFVKEDEGNFNNFIANVDFFKELNFDLISLFDFSRELLLVDNELLKKNYELVKKYDVKLETKNAKYLLALNNSVENIDYYVEAVYDDKITKKTFDGMNIVKTYPSKLDTVNDLTIKRLRYSSENGKKMFGSRENSIAGEIANLKVDVLNIPEDYMNKFFDNNFNDITNEEIESYKEMINNNTDYDFKDSSVLAELNKYRSGNRYTIAGVNVSYNKVLRNYNILINNNVDKDKALEFAVCYNLVCTKEEYEAVVNELKAIGGK